MKNKFKKLNLPDINYINNTLPNIIGLKSKFGEILLMIVSILTY